MATVTTTPIRTFVSGETVTPAKLNELSTPTISVSSIVNADIDASAAIAASKLALTGAIGATQLGTGAITGQTALDALANADSLLIHDDSTSALRKVTWSQIVAAAQPVGSVLQTVQAENSTYSAITSEIPLDDTIPQITEGTEILSATITPSSATSKILIRSFVYADSTGFYPIMAVFRGSVANAIFAHMNYGSSDFNHQCEILDSPNTASAVTYSVRIGRNPTYGGTVHLNGWYGTAARLFGGATKSTLTLQEIKG